MSQHSISKWVWMSWISVKRICQGRNPIFEEVKPNLTSKSGSEIPKCPFNFISINCSSMASTTSCLDLTFFASDLVIRLNSSCPSSLLRRLILIVSYKMFKNSFIKWLELQGDFYRNSRDSQEVPEMLFIPMNCITS